MHAYWPNNIAGTENYTHNLAVELIRAGHQVQIFTAEPNSKSHADHEVERYVEDGIRVTKVHRTGPHYHRIIDTLLNDDYKNVFAELLQEYHPDVVHFQHLKNLSLTLIDQAREYGIHTVYTVHDLWFRCPTVRGYLGNQPCLCNNFQACQTCVDQVIGASIAHKVANPIVQLLVRWDRRNQRIERNRIFREYLRKVDQVVVPSQYLYDQVLSFGVNPTKLLKVQNGVLPPEVEVHKVTHPKLKFIFLANLTIEKGFGLVVDTFKSLANEGYKFVLDVYGRAHTDDSEVANLVNSLNNIPDSKYHGPLSPEEARKIYADYDVSLVPSLWDEIYSLVLDESLAMGTFVLVSNKGALPERVVDGINGKVFDPSEPNSFAQSLRDILEGKVPLTRASQAKTWITMQENSAQILDIYQQLVK